MLGYLSGAVHEGASHASGVDADLVHQLDAAARYEPGGGTLGAAFERAFGKGYAAESSPADLEGRMMGATGMKPSAGARKRARPLQTFRSPASRSRCRSSAGSGRIKAAAARVNSELELLDPEVAERIADAGDEVAAGKHDDQFPIDVFQTGSGASSNMNANEVMANLAGDGHASERPREHGPVVERRLPVGGAPGGPRRGHPRPAAGHVTGWRRRSNASPRSSLTWSRPAALT